MRLKHAQQMLCRHPHTSQLLGKRYLGVASAYIGGRMWIRQPSVRDECHPQAQERI